MKTILYSLIAILLLGSIAPVFTGRTEKTNHFYLKASGNNVSPAAINNSAPILSKRLNLYLKTHDAHVMVVPGKDLLEVVFPASADINMIQDLMTHKGIIAFYEVFDHKEMLDLLGGNNTIFSMMNTDNTDNLSGRLGCVQPGERERINSYLRKLDTGNKCRFAWTQNPESTRTCLLPLKTTGNPVIKSSDIANSEYKEDRILISLTDRAAVSWAETTRRDIGKSIAIVLDDNVLSYPTVRSVIEGGMIEISGRFSESFGNYVAALINSGQLPVEFHIVK
ncbi:MAG TPA: hypothetical protein VJ963_10195 [Bacteroidales bacterium]|nr:hypothetical protein [Bacteroidales bacterium]